MILFVLNKLLIMIKKNEVFNPVKEDTSGVQARRMIWSSRSIELAIEGLKQGRKLIANPFYENNTKLLKGDLNYERTDEEIQEWLRCKNDIIYFVEKYCKLMTPEGIKHVKLRDYQRKYLKHLVDHRLSIYLACRQCGKCVLLTTNVKLKIDFNEYSNIDDKLKSDLIKNYYIKDEECFYIPLFEILNLYEKGFIWKIKYSLYKILYKLEKYEQRQK